MKRDIMFETSDTMCNLFTTYFDRRTYCSVHPHCQTKTLNWWTAVGDVKPAELAFFEKIC